MSGAEFPALRLLPWGRQPGRHTLQAPPQYALQRTDVRPAAQGALSYVHLVPLRVELDPVNLRERAATARSPIERLIVYKRQRGFANPPFVFDLSGERDAMPPVIVPEQDRPTRSSWFSGEYC